MTTPSISPTELLDRLNSQAPADDGARHLVSRPGDGDAVEG
ncbi:MAG: hypothetical protein ABW137_05460 [Mycobacterium sp.]